MHLEKEVRRVAKERHLTVNRALVVLAEEGVQAERDAKQKLRDSYRRFIDEPSGAKKDRAGKDLIRSIFGKDAIAEGPLR